jgi:hypothetical protein
MSNIFGSSSLENGRSPKASVNKTSIFPLNHAELSGGTSRNPAAGFYLLALLLSLSSSSELLGKKNILAIILFLSYVYNSIEESSFMREELQLYFEQFYILLLLV